MYRERRYSYRQYVGLEYVPPYGCLHLVLKVYSELYGIDLDAVAANTPNGLQRFHRGVAEVGDEVRPGDEREGDLILLRTSPWHIGLVVEPGQMLHCYHGGTSTIEDYTLGRWRHKVVGFYRYVGLW